MSKDFHTAKPYSLVDIWKVPYFNEDGTINNNCLYFQGVSPENKQRILDAYFNQ